MWDDSSVSLRVVFRGKRKLKKQCKGDFFICVSQMMFHTTLFFFCFFLSSYSQIWFGFVPSLFLEVVRLLGSCGDIKRSHAKCLAYIFLLSKWERRVKKSQACWGWGVWHSWLRCIKLPPPNMYMYIHMHILREMLIATHLTGWPAIYCPMTELHPCPPQ